MNEKIYRGSASDVLVGTTVHGEMQVKNEGLLYELDQLQRAVDALGDTIATIEDEFSVLRKPSMKREAEIKESPHTDGRSEVSARIIITIDRVSALNERLVTLRKSCDL